MVDQSRIGNTLGKMRHYLGNHNNILISVSGGSDSDIIVHMISTYFRDMLPKVHFVFVDTGLEYKATKEHLDYLEDKYNIQIERIRGKSVVWAVKKYGVPMVSKEISMRLDQYRRNVPSGISWYNGVYNDGTVRRVKTTDKHKELADAVKAKDIKVSMKCCDVSKKKPVYSYIRTHNVDLSITGERRAEGGARAGRHSNCFEEGNHGLVDKYMPLFFWDDDTKEYYKQTEEIRYSDCYEIWGMKRTGCVGCPFNSRCGDDLRMLAKHEPKLFDACMNVFGESYRLTDEFHIHRKQFLDWMDDRQMTMWEES